mmetsp:Transcript_99293/g.148689  ORF Transcript_99293/g.148689 Transcript_99293/m.148689 type:complete len:160 (-) Transcript_99293:17-496(-)
MMIFFPLQQEENVKVVNGAVITGIGIIATATAHIIVVDIVIMIVITAIVIIVIDEDHVIIVANTGGEAEVEVFRRDGEEIVLLKIGEVIGNRSGGKEKIRERGGDREVLCEIARNRVLILRNGIPGSVVGVLKRTEKRREVIAEVQVLIRGQDEDIKSF